MALADVAEQPRIARGRGGEGVTAVLAIALLVYAARGKAWGSTALN